MLKYKYAITTGSIIVLILCASVSTVHPLKMRDATLAGQHICVDIDCSRGFIEKQQARVLGEYGPCKGHGLALIERHLLTAVLVMVDRLSERDQA